MIGEGVAFFCAESDGRAGSSDRRISIIREQKQDDGGPKSEQTDDQLQVSFGHDYVWRVQDSCTKGKVVDVLRSRSLGLAFSGRHLFHGP